MPENWFQTYTEMLAANDARLAQNPPKQTDGLFHCPCCGFPTLEARGDYGICRICWWEDDGQGEADADVVAGGPNGPYSLTHARQNFRRHLHMYDKGAEIAYLKSGSPVRADLLSQVRQCLEQGAAFDTEFFRNWCKRHEAEDID